MGKYSANILNYYQTDFNWKDLDIGTSKIGPSGCALTCASMCVKKIPRLYTRLMQITELSFATGVLLQATTAKHLKIRASLSPTKEWLHF